MRITTLLVLAFFCRAAAAQDPISVSMDVTSADPVTATQIRRRLNDALSEIDDVVVVDFNGRFTVNVVVVKLEASSRIKMGYALSTVITEPFPPDNVQSLVDPEMQDYAALLMEGAVVVQEHSIVIVPGEEIADAVKEIAKELDMQVLQDYREQPSD